MKGYYSTREAAEKLGTALVTLQKYVAKGNFAVPPIVNVGGVRVRLWTANDIARARKALSGIKLGRRPARSRAN
jgi:hypothetical protein